MNKEIRNSGVFKKVSFFAYAICFLLYVPCGLCGYLYFGELTQSDILKGSTTHAGSRPNGLDSTVPVLFARVCVMCAVICCYPLNHYPARAALYSLLFAGEPGEFRPRTSLTTPDPNPNPNPNPNSGPGRPSQRRTSRVKRLARVILTMTLRDGVDISISRRFCGYLSLLSSQWGLRI